MKQKENLIEVAMLECYVELYKNSTPSADFNELVKNAVIDDKGRKHIDFNSYEIEDSKMLEIINIIIKKYKIKNFKKQMFSNSILLGCSPKSKMK